ncbi:hypothetical protein [Saccharopolyspora taberi]
MWQSACRLDFVPLAAPSSPVSATLWAGRCARDQIAGEVAVLVTRRTDG